MDAGVFARNGTRGQDETLTRHRIAARWSRGSEEVLDSQEPSTDCSRAYGLPEHNRPGEGSAVLATLLDQLVSARVALTDNLLARIRTFAVPPRRTAMGNPPEDRPNAPISRSSRARVGSSRKVPAQRCHGSRSPVTRSTMGASERCEGRHPVRRAQPLRASRTPRHREASV